MSRVRLIDIYNERFHESSLKLSAAADIEVVPRKMVEMIIEKCKKEILSDYKSVAAVAEASLIKSYAEELLDKFEANGKV